MARENQGLQIALIIFVMLSILLGVGAFLSFRQYQEFQIKANANVAEARKANDLAQERLNELNELKRMVGVAETEKLDAISNQFNKSIETWAVALSDKNLRSYQAVCQAMIKVLKSNSDALAAAKDELQQFKNKYEARESTKDPQIKQHQQAAEQAAKDYAAEREKVKADLTRVTKEQGDVSSALAEARKKGEADVAERDAKIQAASAERVKLATQNRDLNKRISKLQGDIPESFAGEVRYVNQQTRLAWINLGRADGLNRLTSFSVYPGGATDLKKATRKGSIEVVRILEEHLAEARIVDDNMSDPIMQGDRIETPIWSPGERRHFALAGMIDVDGDGRSDLRTVTQIIEMNGGVVDASTDEKGKRVGEMTSNTRFLVLGTPPDAKGKDSPLVAAYSKMLNDADRLGIDRIPLKDLLNRMGWKQQAKVVQFGPGANPSDFRPRPPEGGVRSSGNAVSELFTPRQPPVKPTNRSAY